MCVRVTRTARVAGEMLVQVKPRAPSLTRNDRSKGLSGDFNRPTGILNRRTPWVNEVLKPVLKRDDHRVRPIGREFSG